ncbi:MAG: hypothetical protein AAF220_14770, partial [Pseudomonadota bacterium]
DKSGLHFQRLVYQRHWQVLIDRAVPALINPLCTTQPAASVADVTGQGRTTCSFAWSLKAGFVPASH